jgi:hypothetical protein
MKNIHMLPRSDKQDFPIAQWDASMRDQRPSPQICAGTIAQLGVEMVIRHQTSLLEVGFRLTDREAGGDAKASALGAQGPIGNRRRIGLVVKTSEETLTVVQDSRQLFFGNPNETKDA